MFFCKQKTAYEMRISDWSSDECSSDLAVQAKHDDIVTAEGFMDSARLRQAVTDGAGTQHLERLDHHHPAAQRIERWRRIGVEPLNCLDRGRRAGRCCHRIAPENE